MLHALSPLAFLAFLCCSSLTDSLIMNFFMSFLLACNFMGMCACVCPLCVHACYSVCIASFRSTSSSPQIQSKIQCIVFCTWHMLFHIWLGDGVHIVACIYALLRVCCRVYMSAQCGCLVGGGCACVAFGGSFSLDLKWKQPCYTALSNHVALFLRAFVLISFACLISACFCAYFLRLPYFCLLLVCVCAPTSQVASSVPKGQRPSKLRGAHTHCLRSAFGKS